MDKREIATIILATIIMALAASFKDTSIFYVATLSFLIIISVNIIAKKIVGFHFETDVKTKFWTWYRFGLRQDMHFKSPVPMAWLPLLLALFTKGHLLWLGILEFDIAAKAERVAKRHGIYRFTQVTEWHMAWIAIWGIIANLIFAIGAYALGFELFAKLSIYFIAWNTIPIGRLDGAKIFYANRALWTIIFAITAIVLGWGIVI
ncbi:hypothetical protein J4226_04880 [Candidatus Pacearchaeota archaeon]|nr:hypothetical protein [Candidatus Pacearchaeota archaeon]